MKKMILISFSVLISGLFLFSLGAGPNAAHNAASQTCGDSDASLQLKLFSNSCSANQVQDIFEVINNGAPVTLSDITIKFWADDTSASPLTGSIFYGGCLTNPSCFHQVAGVSLTASKFSPACGPDPRHQANWEITVSTNDPTVLKKGETWSNVQASVHRADWQNFSPGTGFWYSPCVISRNYTAGANYAVYVRGLLVTASGGIPPACRAPATCTPTPTLTFTPSPTFTRGTQNDEASESDDPRTREAFFHLGRKSPDSAPAAQHWLTALQQANALPPINRANFLATGRNASPMGLKPFAPPAIAGLGTSCDWSELGPSPLVYSPLVPQIGNVSGRITSLVTDLAHDPTGNTVYLGAAFGGVWLSTDGGANFTKISDPTQDMAVGAIAVGTNSSGQTVVYVGTGETNLGGDSYYGAGIMTLTNSGTLPWTTTLVQNATNGSMLGLSFSKILIDPNNPDVLLAAAENWAFGTVGLTLSPGGIYRTTNGRSTGGITWTRVFDFGVNPSVCEDLAFDPTVGGANGTYYAAFYQNGIYRSTGQGASGSWAALTSTNNPNPGSPFPSGVSANANSFFRASLTARNGSLYALVCGVFNIGCPGAGYIPSVPGAGDTGLFKYTGTTWSNISLPNDFTGFDIFTIPTAPCLTQGFYDIYVGAPPPATSNVLVVGGINAFRTNNVNSGTGASWINMTNAYSSVPVQAHSDQHAIAFKDANNWYIGNDGGIWSFNNSSSSLTDLNATLGTIQYQSVSPDVAAQGTYFGGAQDNGISKTTSGNPLSPWALVNGGDGGFTDTNSSVPGEYLGETAGLNLVHSTSSGAIGSFTTVIDGNTIGDTAAFYVPFTAIQGSPTTVVLGTTRVWMGPTTGSVGWAAAGQFLVANGNGNRFIQAVAVPYDDPNPNTIYASTTDGSVFPAVCKVFMTTNGRNIAASNWVDVTGNLPTTRPINCIVTNDTIPQFGTGVFTYAAIQGFNNGPGGHIFRSSPNNPASWTDITGNLPDAPANWVLVDPINPNDVYVATDVGVFATRNVNGSGTNWGRLVGSGGVPLPETAILQVKMTNTCPRRIVAATHGRGAWTICPLFNNDYQTVQQTNGSQAADGNFTKGIFGTALLNSSLYVADGHDRIQQFDLNANWVATLGSHGTGAGQFVGPFGVAADTTLKRLYVLEQGDPLGEITGTVVNARVQSFDPLSNNWTPIITPGTGTGGGGTAFNGPLAIAVDPLTGDIYVADQQPTPPLSGTGVGLIEKFSSTGVFQRQWQTFAVTSLAIDPTNGLLYAGSQSDHVDVYNIRAFPASPLTAPPPVVASWGTSTAFTTVGPMAIGPAPDYDLFQVLGGGPSGGTSSARIFSTINGGGFGTLIGQVRQGPAGPQGGNGGFAGIAVDSCGDLFASHPGSNGSDGFVEKHSICGQSCSPAPAAVRPAPKAMQSEVGRTPTATPTATPSPTVTPTPGIETVAVVAVPNISRGGEPLQFKVALPKAGPIHLTLLTLTGEQVYQATASGQNGFNTLVWNVQNQQGSTVASGLYLYIVQVDQGGEVTTRSGKIAVIH